MWTFNFKSKIKGEIMFDCVLAIYFELISIYKHFKVKLPKNVMFNGF